MRFFYQYPAIGAIALFLTLAAGVLIGHRSDIPLPDARLRASISGKPRAPALERSVLQRFELAHSKVQRGELVQQLEDGSRVVLTLDPALQQRAQRLLTQYEVPYGAVVAYDLRSGETLVLAGHAHDAPEISAQELCLSPWAPAASVFKLVSASALLSLGVPSSTSICYHGGMSSLSAAQLTSNPTLDRDCATLGAGVARSLNPVIAKLADRHLPSKLLARWANRFGFNRPLPFDLPAQPSRAQVPSSRLELARTAAGFWHTDLSPLHGAVIAGVAATGGLLRWPHVIRRVEHDGKRRSAPARPASARVLEPAVARELSRMMLNTVRVGTASRAFSGPAGRSLLHHVQIGGKTGSLSRTDPYLGYSWFVGFARSSEREIAFAVLLGNPPRWRIKANTAARELLSAIFHG